MSATVQGRRVTLEPHLFGPGDYGYWDGIWYGRAPTGDFLANLSKHAVVEHEDGTITVTPSILVSDRTSSWHGFLECGVWRTA